MKLILMLTKEREICFISHLEYMKTIERAIKRAKLPVAYSEGFNPHMKLSLASALGVGVSSMCELCEIEFYRELDKQTIVEALQAALPRGIKIIGAQPADKKADKLMASVQAADYEVTVELLPHALLDTLVVYADYAKLTTMSFEKKMPRGKGSKIVDVKDFVGDVAFNVKEGKLTVKFSCKITPTGSLKATEIMSALKEYLHLPVDLTGIEVVRTALYKFDQDNNRQDLIRF